MTANITCFVRGHGGTLVGKLADRHEDAYFGFLNDYMAERIRKEGQEIQKYLTRQHGTPITEVVDRFSLQNFKADLQGIAPSLWSVMVSASTRDERGSGSIRDKELVFVTICAMFSMLRSQKANNFQVVIGLFLLGSGALKREMEVLAHAGFSVSYNSIIYHIRLLSAENVQKFRKAIKDFMCSIVWDNLNIAFHIGEQR
ncbi:hypothetical protein K435DRAFT_695896, partial [Dendrothele bispora CBS 962.96]